jgi:hypothetical protein
MPQALYAADGVPTSVANIQAAGGRWQAAEMSHQLLDPEIVSSGRTGFEIVVDKKIGASHRRTSGSDEYYSIFAKFLRDGGYEPLATGRMKTDLGDEAEFIISKKDGSLFLWHGIVTGANARIFLGWNTDKSSVDVFVVEWTESCPLSPLDVQYEYGTVIYKRRTEEAKGSTDVLRVDR